MTAGEIEPANRAYHTVYSCGLDTASTGFAGKRPPCVYSWEYTSVFGKLAFVLGQVSKTKWKKKSVNAYQRALFREKMLAECL